jgi:hypothetical protein
VFEARTPLLVDKPKGELRLNENGSGIEALMHFRNDTLDPPLLIVYLSIARRLTEYKLYILTGQRKACASIEGKKRRQVYFFIERPMARMLKALRVANSTP